MQGGLGKEGDQFHIINFMQDTGEHQSVAETTSQLIFVAPDKCEIIDIGLAVTTAVTANTTNHWTINITNQTGDVEMLSDNFDTDSDNSGNGGRSLTADALTSLCDDGEGTNYLTGAILAKGDMLKLTATKAASGTALAYPVFVIRYRV